MGIYKDADPQKEYSDNEKILVHTRVLVERKQNSSNSAYGNSKFLKCDKCGGQNPQKTLCCNKKICANCKLESRRVGKCIFCGLTQLQSEKQMQIKNENLRRIKESLNFPSSREYFDFLENARFFFIRSCNQENISFALQESIWATTQKNQRPLFDAFNSCSNIILIFGVNKTNYFQGVAKMLQPVKLSKRTPWKNNDAIKFGQDFNIRWLRVDDLNYSSCTDLKNTLSNNEPLTAKPKDCQEIDVENGKKLCMRFSMGYEYDNSYQGHHSNYQPQQQQQPQQLEQQLNIKGNQLQHPNLSQHSDIHSNLQNFLPQQVDQTTNILDDKLNSNSQVVQTRYQVPQLLLNENTLAEKAPKETTNDSNGISEFIKQYNQSLELQEEDFFSIIEELQIIRQAQQEQQQQNHNLNQDLLLEEEQQHSEHIPICEDNQFTKVLSEESNLKEISDEQNGSHVERNISEIENVQGIEQEESNQEENYADKVKNSDNITNDEQLERSPSSLEGEQQIEKKEDIKKILIQEEKIISKPTFQRSIIPPTPVRPGMNPMMLPMGLNFNQFFPQMTQMMDMTTMPLNPALMGQFGRNGNLGIGDNQMMNLGMMGMQRMGMGVNMFNNNGGGGVYDNKKKPQPDEAVVQNDNTHNQDSNEENSQGYRQENGIERDDGQSYSSRDDYPNRNANKYNKNRDDNIKRQQYSNQNNQRSNYIPKQNKNNSSRYINHNNNSNNNVTKGSNRGQRQNFEKSNSNLDNYHSDDMEEEKNIDKKEKRRSRSRERKERRSKDRKDGRKRDKDRSSSTSNHNNSNHNNSNNNIRNKKRSSNSASRKKRERK